MGRSPGGRSTSLSVRGVAVLAALIMLAGCARNSPVTAADLPSLPASSGATTPSTAPLPTEPSPTPTPSVTPSPTPPPKPVDPLAGVSAKTRKAFKPCLTKAVGPHSGGACARLVQKTLKSVHYYNWGIASRINTAGVNAILNYQRSRGLAATGVVRKATWIALATKARVIPQVLPKKCTTTKGVILCVDQAHRKLFWIRNGKVVKTFKIRVGGWNYYVKSKKWKVFATANGTWKVYDKQVDPPSEQYGSGAMPYATIFYPDMYVHYSPGFHAVGYATSSHGCVNIGKLSEAMWIFKHTPIGAKVYIYSQKVKKTA
ncbi:MAG TPA: L,D-transpeptidase family protein [Propionicimonas sp.]|jgi:lipoprotein-anchoring transpeptidase ErfK/SrfK|uniref:L,D-transpeptidase family protein n=1 Tax=Propionicimonas sp. TaxID=1955623 RepID=UPI002F3E2E69